MIPRSELQPSRDESAPSARAQPVVGRAAWCYAFVIVGMRYVVVLGWLAAVALAVLYLPSLSAGSGVGDLVPSGSAALRAEADATGCSGCR